jgi:hypothetical protein
LLWREDESGSYINEAIRCGIGTAAWEQWDGVAGVRER